MTNKQQEWGWGVCGLVGGNDNDDKDKEEKDRMMTAHQGQLLNCG